MDERAPPPGGRQNSPQEMLRKNATQSVITEGRPLAPRERERRSSRIGSFLRYVVSPRSNASEERRCGGVFVRKGIFSRLRTRGVSMLEYYLAEASDGRHSFGRRSSANNNHSALGVNGKHPLHTLALIDKRVVLAFLPFFTDLCVFAYTVPPTPVVLSLNELVVFAHSLRVVPFRTLSHVSAVALNMRMVEME
uniref:Uncharacterized protein n=1 Tax=Plectus sambesii TaxID=2011161 RepID=A0A914V127_9BILA